MVLEIELKFASDIRSGKVNIFIAKKLLLHLDQFFLRRIDLSQYQRDLFRNEREVLLSMKKQVVITVFWGSSESIKGKKIGSDNTEDHDNVDCRRTKSCSFKSGSAVPYFKRNRSHIGASLEPTYTEAGEGEGRETEIWS